MHFIENHNKSWKELTLRVELEDLSEIYEIELKNIIIKFTNFANRDDQTTAIIIFSM